MNTEAAAGLDSIYKMSKWHQQLQHQIEFWLNSAESAQARWLEPIHKWSLIFVSREYRDDGPTKKHHHVAFHEH